MDIAEIDKSKEYEFSKAWNQLLEEDVIITSKNTGDSYIVERRKGKKILKFYSQTISTWRVCTHVSPEEMFDKWYITKSA